MGIFCYGVVVVQLSEEPFHGSSHYLCHVIKMALLVVERVLVLREHMRDSRVRRISQDEVIRNEVAPRLHAVMKNHLVAGWD